MSTEQIKFVFFGGEPLGVPALEALKAADLLPDLIVCNPDRPVGRKQILTPPPVKVWAQENEIEVFQPTAYTGVAGEKVRAKLASVDWDLFVVVAYNFILPNWLLALPTHHTINLHPSLLPKYRGASPIRSTILNDDREAVGVSVIRLDEKMDHGPLLTQQAVVIPNEEWPIAGPTLDTLLATIGGNLLAKIIPQWIAGTITLIEQEHAAASYCGQLNKEMGLLTLDPYHLPAGAPARAAYLKIQAFAGWPGTFFIHNGKRIKIAAAHLNGEQLTISKIIPEGKAEQDFSIWLQNQI